MQCASVSFDFVHRYFDKFGKCIGSRLLFKEARTLVRCVFEQAQWTAQRTIFPVVGALAGAWACFGKGMGSFFLGLPMFYCSQRV
jgi:hypothetical protein